MADGLTVKLTGAKELHDALGEFTKATERNILLRVGKAALQPIADRAKALAPVDEGDLRDSIIVGTKLTKNARRNAKRDPVQGVRVFVGPTNRNGVPREFGTARTVAHPFMRPAWDSGKAGVLADVMDGLKVEIDKAQQRAARRKPKG